MDNCHQLHFIVRQETQGDSPTVFYEKETFVHSSSQSKWLDFVQKERFRHNSKIILLSYHWLCCIIGFVAFLRPDVFKTM